MRAFSEMYVTDAQEHLGAMLDFAANGCHFDIAEFYELFLASSYFHAFEEGSSRVLAGMSGVELALRVMQEAKVAEESLAAGWTMARTFFPIGGATPEYWTGWALAFYQWSTGKSFALIQADVPIEQISALYHPFHEMDLTSFCWKMDSLSTFAHPKTRLHYARKRAGLSQSQLAEAAGIPTRTLQQYEQGQKSIDRAQVQYVLSLARVLHCEPASLLEYSDAPRYEYDCLHL